LIYGNCRYGYYKILDLGSKIEKGKHFSQRSDFGLWGLILDKFRYALELETLKCHTWATITYPSAKESRVAARNFQRMFKPWGKEVLAKIEKTRRYFNESHQARLQQFKVRKELIYQTQVKSAQNLIKPKGYVARAEYVAYAAAQELAMATPMPRTLSQVSQVSPLASYESTITSLMHEAQQINVSIQELTDARDQCKAKCDLLGSMNEVEGYEYSPSTSSTMRNVRTH
jgi:hypothetical protein